MPSFKKTFCVLVTYNPNLLQLKCVINSILENKVRLVVVDNNSANKLDLIQIVDNLCELFCLDQNYGIAYAQNLGIKHAIDSDCDYVWLSDQDSVYPPNYAYLMHGAFVDVSLQSSNKIAGIGPSFFDNNRGCVQPIVQLSPFTKKFLPSPGLNLVSHCIASGMFIPSSMFALVGLKNNRFFIDWVDMEWCWRAKYIEGFDILVNGDVHMEHSLGDSNFNFLGYKLIIRSPFRHYFMVRNAVYMSLHATYLPLPLRLELFSKAFLWSFVFPLISPSNKLNHLKAVLSGFFDGLINRLGPR